MPDNKMSLKLISGVIETGLFVSTADLVINIIILGYVTTCS